MTEQELDELARRIRTGGKQKRITRSFLLALWMLLLTSAVSAATVYLMYLCVVRSYTGALYPLSALITLCQAGNAVVLSRFTDKSRAENTKGGIVYETAVQDGTRDL